MTANQIRTALRSLADSTIAAHSQRFFKTGIGEYGEGDRFLGIRVPVIRRQVRQFRATPLVEIEILLRSPYHEERLCALLLLVDQFGKAQQEQRAVIYRIYLNNTAYINNWDLVDCSAHRIVGPYLENKERSTIHKLSRSRNLWDRRIAVMSTFHFIKLNQFDDLFAMAIRLIQDREDLIHKATGWMLREVGKRDPAALTRFLKQYYNEMPRTMFRYSIEQLPEPQRKRYLTGTA